MYGWLELGSQSWTSLTRGGAAGFVLALVSLGWQSVTWRLSGSRAEAKVLKAAIQRVRRLNDPGNGSRWARWW
jgi:hypothetical protein